MTLLLLLFSLPLGLFCAWFAWRAHCVGRREAARSMAMLSALLLAGAGLVGGWIALALAG